MADIEDCGRAIVDSGLKVHRALGPGLLESIYEQCLPYEVEKRGVQCRRQAPLPIVYDGVAMAAAYRLDILVEEQIIVEVKSVELLTPLHQAQLLTYPEDIRMSDRFPHELQRRAVQERRPAVQGLTSCSSCLRGRSRFCFPPKEPPR